MGNSRPNDKNESTASPAGPLGAVTKRPKDDSGRDAHSGVRPLDEVAAAPSGQHGRANAEDPGPASDPDPLLYGDQGEASRVVGRCELFAEIASGGMATIHLGRWLGAGGFTKPVAVKALHPHYAKDPEFVAMFLDEARVVARIQHPNVMPTIDLVDERGELFIVMEYVEGVALNYLMRKARQRGELVPVDIALRIVTGVLNGLHAAHEATNERGEPMCLIHRDVSPENIMVGVDGFPRLIDFGIATALGRYSQTREGQVKGKLCYLSPEQVLGEPLTRKADIFAASIVLWQVLTGHRLFKAENAVEVAHRLLNLPIPAPSEIANRVPKSLDKIVMRGLRRNLAERWDDAEKMAAAIEAVARLAPHRTVGQWVRRIAGERIAKNARAVKAMERAPVRAATDALNKPMSVRPAPPDAISEELAADLQQLGNMGRGGPGGSITDVGSGPLPLGARVPKAEAGDAQELEWMGEPGLPFGRDPLDSSELIDSIAPPLEERPGAGEGKAAAAEPASDEAETVERDLAEPDVPPSPLAGDEAPAAMPALRVREPAIEPEPAAAEEELPAELLVAAGVARKQTSTTVKALGVAAVSAVLTLAVWGGIRLFDEPSAASPAQPTGSGAAASTPAGPGTGAEQTAAPPTATEAAPTAGATDSAKPMADAGAAPSTAPTSPGLGPGPMPTQTWGAPTPSPSGSAWSPDEI